MGSLEQELKKVPQEALDRFIAKAVSQLLDKILSNPDFQTQLAIKLVKRVRVPKDGVNGKDGFSPIPGVDFFTDEDKKDIIKAATPKKGVDFFTKEEKNKFIDEVKAVSKPIPGVDFEIPKLNLIELLELLTGEDVVKLINNLELSPEKQIDAKHIKNLPQATDARRGTSLHRGGLKLIWNTQLEGTVNGTNTIFTIPSSLPAPKDNKYLVSARGVAKDVDSGDFTISSDNKTVTFTTAPPSGSAQPRVPIYEGK